MPPIPPEWSGSIYSTADELLVEIRKVLGVLGKGPIQLEMSAGCVEEAIEAKGKIANMREDLRTIDEDACWMLARIRETTLGDPLICRLFEENGGGTWHGVNLDRNQFRFFKNTLIKSTLSRGLSKSLNTQMLDFVERVNEVYKK